MSLVCVPAPLLHLAPRPVWFTFPRFHAPPSPQLVKRAIVSVMDKDKAQQQTMAEFLKFLHVNEVLPALQVRAGLDKILKTMPDLRLDSPSAPLVFDFFEKYCEENGLLHGTSGPAEGSAEQSLNEDAPQGS